MTQKKTVPRIKIEVEVDCDKDRLYGNIDGAIKYLQEIKEKYPSDIVLDEHWTGYEDMTMRFVYCRDETDEEYNRRLADEAAKAEIFRRAQIEEKAKNERRKEYERLSREFGRGY
jgi:hypothetical protein